MPTRSTPVYGIDTSVFVRMLTGHPETDFRITSASLQKLFENEPTAELVVSNQVIGKSYITLIYHYKLSKGDACIGIRDFLKEGMVSALNGSPVLEALSQEGGAGLMDRLIVQDYQSKGLRVLTNDQKMARIPGVSDLVRDIP
jgi:predicted nucleic acid-binding protein